MVGGENGIILKGWDRETLSAVSKPFLMSGLPDAWGAADRCFAAAAAKDCLA